MFAFIADVFPERWNRDIVLLPHDKLLTRTVIPLLPARLRPNHLTVFRLLLTPAVLVLLARDNYVWGVPLFLFAAFTDVLDGSLARVRRQVTEWGIAFDPVVDKLLIGSVLIVIVISHINWLLGLALIAVEAITIVLGWRRWRRGVIAPANFWGKVKMVSEVAGIMLLLAALWLRVNLLMDVSVGTLALALVFAIASLLVRLK